VTATTAFTVSAERVPIGSRSDHREHDLGRR
jgi:hypothetical protein